MKNNQPYGQKGGHESATLFAAKEAYRTIRTNLMISIAKSDCKTILFTSSISGEGKTTTAANVAFSIAKNHRKVLLIDMDLRNPHIHRVLKKPKVPGLTNYLSGFSSLDEVLYRDVYPGLDLICAGTTSPNPAEMVASEGVANLLKQMKSQYDFIILDTSPVNAVSDALTVVSHTDGVVLVIRPRYADRKEVRKCISQLEFVDAKILGVVANGVQDQKRVYGKRYGYGYRYGRRYGYGYGYGRTAELKPQGEKTEQDFEGAPSEDEDAE